MNKWRLRCTLRMYTFYWKNRRFYWQKKMKQASLDGSAFACIDLYRLEKKFLNTMYLVQNWLETYGSWEKKCLLPTRGLIFEFVWPEITSLRPPLPVFQKKKVRWKLVELTKKVSWFPIKNYISTRSHIDVIACETVSFC